jgi:hypothetical protein
MAADRDPFDLDSLRVDPADPNLKPRGFGSAGGGGAKTHKKKWEKKFISFPWWWLNCLKTTKSCATLKLALLLAYEHWRTGGRVVRLTNILAAAVGVSPDAKGRALDELERAGLIKIERRPRKSPRVTVLVDPPTGP